MDSYYANDGGEHYPQVIRITIEKDNSSDLLESMRQAIANKQSAERMAAMLGTPSKTENTLAEPKEMIHTSSSDAFLGSVFVILPMLMLIALTIIFVGIFKSA
jgi:hypothetical protein